MQIQSSTQQGFVAGAAKSAASGRHPDYTNISRADMKAASNDLWKAGKIDLQELGMLQLAGPLGKVGPNGEFIPFTAAERAELDRQPVDYVSVAERAIAEIDYRHAAGDARSGYEKWKHILETLQRP